MGAYRIIPQNGHFALPDSIKTLLLNIAAALSYSILALLSLSLVISPDKVALFWPAAGLAFAFVYSFGPRVVPGVFLGALAFHFYHVYEGAIANEFYALQTIEAVILSSTATLQAFISAKLCQYFVGPNVRLEKFSEISKFCILAGPIACMISPILSVLTLYLCGTIEGARVINSIMTWYVGDTFGVLIAGTIGVLLLNGKNATISRKTYVIVPVVLVFCFLISVFFYAKDIEDKQFRQSVVNEANDARSSLNMSWEVFLQKVFSIQGLYNASESVTEEEFLLFTKSNFMEDHAVAGFAWAPKVISRDEFEKHAGPIKSFETYDKLPVGHDLGIHFPIEFMRHQNEEYNQKYKGFDYLSSDSRRDALMKAIKTNAPAMTPPIQLFEKKIGAVVFLPVYNSSSDVLSDPSKRSDATKGVITAAFYYQDLLEAFTKERQEMGIEMRIVDAMTNTVAYESGGFVDGKIKDKVLFSRIVELSFADRLLTLEFYKIESILLGYSSTHLKYIIIFSLAFALLITFFVLILTGQAEVIRQKVNEQTEEILRQTQFLNLVMDTMADGFTTIKSDGTIASFNNACERIFGLSEEEAIGQKMSILLSDKEAKIAEEDFEEFVNGMRSEMVFGFGLGRELEGKRSDNGKVFPMHVSGAEFELGGESFYSAIIRDISKQKEMEDELKRSNQELEDFAYVASHDLKAPLRHVSMSAEFFYDMYHEKVDEKGKDFIEIITSGTHRMQKMIDSLLAYSRVGRDQKSYENTNLNDVVAGVITVMDGLISDTKAELEVHDLPVVHGDQYLLMQLFQNLIENALKYKKPDVIPKIVIRADEESPDKYLITVQDNGIGVAPEHAEKIFKVFQRLHRDDDIQGVGIGLAVCQRIVEAHGGKIWLDKNYNDGCLFKFTLVKNIPQSA